MTVGWRGCGRECKPSSGAISARPPPGHCRTRYDTCNQNRDCAGRYRHFGAQVLERLAADAVRHLLDCPRSLAAALRADSAKQRALYDQAARADETEQLVERRAGIAEDLRNTKKLMLAAIRAGLREDDFAPELARIAHERRQVLSRLSELTAAVRAADRPTPEDAASKVAKFADAIVRVFTASDDLCSRAEKRTGHRKATARRGAAVLVLSWLCGGPEKNRDTLWYARIELAILLATGGADERIAELVSELNYLAPTRMPDLNCGMQYVDGLVALGTPVADFRAFLEALWAEMANATAVLRNRLAGAAGSDRGTAGRGHKPRPLTFR